MTAATLRRRSRRLADAKPFLKWVGGKRQLLPEITRHAPKSFGRYHEPFVGGGAVFFHLRRTQGPFPAFLTDSNQRLIRAYRGVQNERRRGDRAAARARAQAQQGLFPEDARPARHRHATDDRGRSLDDLSQSHRRTTVSIASTAGTSSTFPSASTSSRRSATKRTCRPARGRWRGAELEHAGFESVLNRAQAGDFVYFDPPYQPLTATAKFTDYTSEGFGDEDQERLRDVALKLKNAGRLRRCFPTRTRRSSRSSIATDSSSTKVGARRAVNSDPKGRGLVQELILK